MKTIKDVLAPQSRYHREINSTQWDERRHRFLSDGKIDNCQSCRQRKPLQVHHVNYVSGRAVWDYQDHELIALCFECHKTYHEMFRVSRALFVKLPAVKVSELMTCMAASFKVRGPLETLGRIQRALL